MIGNDTSGRGTAWHFADWVFRKTNPNYHRNEYSSATVERKKLGRFGHQDIDNMQLWMSRVKALQGASSGFRLLYSDPHDGSDASLFNASRLIVDGKPMRCKPDVVLYNSETGMKIVIERKVTVRKEYRIPPEAWPNVRAQLWCYGWIDEWANDQDIILICRYFRPRPNDDDWTKQDEKNPWIINYDVYPGWRRSDPEFYSENLKYFKEYGGEFF